MRLLARDPQGLPPELLALGLDVARGDFTDLDSVRPALQGITHVIHLARGNGNTWAEFLKYDVEPTRRLAELCLEAKVERFIYSSSIAIYAAGNKGEVIDEDTKPVDAMLRANPYARSKVENERILIQLEFQRPFAATSLATFTFKPQGNATAVEWALEGDKNYLAKAVHLVLDMDKMVGADFEAGLANLKAAAEKP